MRSFFKNRSITPQPWEIDLLATLDLLSLEQQPKPRPAPPPRPTP